MEIDTKNMFSISEANQNFSKVVKHVDENGNVIILKNNKPKYIVKKFDNDEIVISEEEKMEIIARRILKKYKHAFEVLGQ